MLKRGFLNDKSQVRENDDKRENNHKPEPPSNSDIQRSFEKYRADMQQPDQASSSQANSSTENRRGGSSQYMGLTKGFFDRDKSRSPEATRQQNAQDIRQPEQAESSQAGESSRQPERLSIEQLERLNEEIGRLPSDQQQEAFLDSFPEMIKLQISLYKIKDSLKTFSEIGAIDRKSAEERIAAMELLEDKIVKNEEVEPSMKKGFIHFAKEFKGMLNKSIGIAYSTDISDKYEKMTEEGGEENSANLLIEMNKLRDEGLATQEYHDDRMDEMYDKLMDMRMRRNNP